LHGASDNARTASYNQEDSTTGPHLLALKEDVTNVRRTLQFLGIFFWSVLSLDIVVGILDWLGRWDWLVSFIGAHSRVASVVRTPFAYLGLLILGFLFLASERFLKQPRLLVHLLNSRTIPDLHTTPVAALFESQAKSSGWDERKLDWDCFLETQVTNDSDTPTTVTRVEARARVKHKWWETEEIGITHSEDFGGFVMDRGLDVNLKGVAHSGERYVQLPSLTEKIRNIPLTRGIGHSGWLRFRLPQVSQKDMNGGNLRIDFWLVDALGVRHKMEHDKKSEQQWDKNFYIFNDK